MLSFKAGVAAGSLIDAGATIDNSQRCMRAFMLSYSLECKLLIPKHGPCIHK